LPPHPSSLADPAVSTGGHLRHKVKVRAYYEHVYLPWKKRHSKDKIATRPLSAVSPPPTINSPLPSLIGFGRKRISANLTKALPTRVLVLYSVPVAFHAESFFPGELWFTKKPELY